MECAICGKELDGSDEYCGCEEDYINFLNINR